MMTTMMMITLLMLITTMLNETVRTTVPFCTGFCGANTVLKGPVLQFHSAPVSVGQIQFLKGQYYSPILHRFLWGKYSS